MQKQTTDDQKQYLALQDKTNPSTHYVTLSNKVRKLSPRQKLLRKAVQALDNAATLLAQAEDHSTPAQRILLRQNFNAVLRTQERIENYSCMSDVYC